jgi:hypothetical protein
MSAVFQGVHDGRPCRTNYYFDFGGYYLRIVGTSNTMGAKKSMEACLASHHLSAPMKAGSTKANDTTS